MPYTPSDKEQEYFLRLEMERLSKLRAEHREKTEAETRQKLKELHWMRCPKCGVELSVAHVRGVEVDLCPGCGGLFLDGGEIDKVIEESNRGGFAASLGAFRRWWKE
jgi:hypothetical protein